MVSADARGYYERHKSLLRMTISGSLVRGSPGGGEDELRKAQVGAAFAVAAHFTASAEPALVSMPTGSGKSAVMTLLPFLLGSQRVLVVTPSRLLREQLAAEFLLLTVLRRRGVTPEEMVGPRVQVVTSRADDQAWQGLAEFDVAIGTVNVLSPGYAGVAPPPAGLFDLLLIDEAHHAATSTYRDLLDAFRDVPAVLFTATPFRRDRHHLPAAAVYTYGLGQALDDGVLAPVDFQPVDVPPGSSQTEWDLALVAAALEVLARPEHRVAESRLIARTRSVEHATKLVEVYRAAGAEMGLITAATSATQVRRVLGRLDSGALVGLISVGVLGEGFDFPRLKIAVYHRRHASLPATLQFLGRITRLVPGGPAACLLAVREEVNDETRDLYAGDVAWAKLVPSLADAAVESEVRRRTYLRGFDPEPTQPLSLSALRPREDVKVLRLSADTAVDLRTPVLSLGGGEVIYQGADNEGRLAVIVTEHLDRPEWMVSDTLDRLRYELHVVVRDPSGRFLFVHGTRDTTIIALVELLGEDKPRQVDPLWLDRMMAAMPLVSYHSVGMRSTRAAGGRLAAYRMMAGTDVATAVLPSETRSYGTGHAIAQVRDPTKAGTDTSSGFVPITSVGVSFGRAKVFSSLHAQLLDFRAWCDRLAKLAANQAAANPTGLPGLALRSPRSINEFPQHPYLVTLEPTVLWQGFVLRDLRSDQLVGLERFELTAARESPDKLLLTGSVDGSPQWTGSMDTLGNVSSTDHSLVVEHPGRHETSFLTEFLSDNPPSVFYADGATTIGAALFRASDDYPDLPSAVLSDLPFVGVDLRAESKDPRPGMITIKDHLASWFAADPDVEFVIDDDRSGEIADLVVIYRRSATGMRQVFLVHCKYSSKNVPGARVGDLYEVLGQAGRSVVWLRPDLVAGRLTERLRSGSRVAHGDTAELDRLFAEWNTDGARVDWTIVVVQPGLRSSAVNTKRNIKVMFSDVLEWISQHGAGFRVIAHS